MSNDIYPGDLRGLTFSAIKTAEHSTIVQRAVSGLRVTIANFANPLWHWTLEYSVLPDQPGRLSVGYHVTDYRFLQGFNLAHRGQFADFLFYDPTDNFVGPPLNLDSTPNLLAALQVVTDGVTYYSPLQRLFGGQFYEDITDLASAPIVYSGGASRTVTTDYIVQPGPLVIPGFSFAGPYLQWPAPPALPVTVQFDFYFRACFESDSLDFEQFAQDLWAIGGDGGSKGTGELKLMSARRTA